MGGSGKLLSFVNKGLIEGVVSEIIYDEVRQHLAKLGLSETRTTGANSELFKKILQAPGEIIVRKYKKIVIDEGDAHVLASCHEAKIKYLVSLDKKHLLILKGKIKGLKIMTPGELIELMVNFTEKII